MKGVIARVLVALCAADALARSETEGGLPVGVGVDAIDLLFHYLPSASGGIQSPRNRSFAIESMHHACQNGFSTIRAAGGGFWPDDMQIWQSNSSMWWNAVQTAVSDAEAANCSLMLTLFWNTFAFPDMAKLPLPSIADETSSTWGLMSRYIHEMVEAVGTSKAIVAWEVTNELNLLMDLDMAGRKTSIAPSRGTPTERTQADNMSTAVGVQFGKNVVSLLARLDPYHRPVSAGYSMPRSSAFHLMQSYPTGKQDFTLDTQEQFEEVLRIIHEPFEIASAHLYAHPGPDGNVRFNTTPVAPYDTAFLGIFNQAIRGMGKQPLLGEFGDPLPGARPWAHAVLSSLGPVGQTPTDGASALPGDASKRTGITTALVWCWEFYQRSATIPANFSLVPGRDDDVIELMEQTNSRLRSGMATLREDGSP